MELNKFPVLRASASFYNDKWWICHVKRGRTRPPNAKFISLSRETGRVVELCVISIWLFKIWLCLVPRDFISHLGLPTPLTEVLIADEKNSCYEPVICHQ